MDASRAAASFVVLDEAYTAAVVESADLAHSSYDHIRRCVLNLLCDLTISRKVQVN
jgi:hypothetical protein